MSRVKNNKRKQEEELPKALRKNNSNTGRTTKQIKGQNLKSSQNKKRKVIKKIIRLIIIVGIITIAIKTAISVNTFKGIVLDMSNNKNSIVYDKKGNKIAKIGEEHAKKKISLNKMPENLKNAYVAIEDERFYKHGGIDIKRTAGAIVSYIFHREGSFGGSTITQQLVKNLTGDNASKITRKVNEWWRAVVVDATMSKEEILELYLNSIYVGPNVYGVETGAQYYFSKSAKNLKLEECAFLAGINHSPNSYNPFNGEEKTDIISKRTKIVLSKMKELNYISEKEYNNAINKVNKGLSFNKGTIEVGKALYSYHTDALINQAVADLQEQKNISKSFAENYLNMGNLKIRSTQDSKIQNEIETEFDKYRYKLTSPNGNESQAAMVTIDHSTGQVVGCVGGIGQKTVSRGFNRATQSLRQTGSSIKPLAVLVPGIDKKTFTAATIFSDKKRTFKKNYSPEDYSEYLGDVTVRIALESSQNVPFVEMMERIGPSEAIKYLEKMGITTLTKKDDDLVLALGGLDVGISPLQMAGAYATIANNGEYIEPTFFTTIENNNGDTVITAKQDKRQVFSEQVAYIIKELLTEPVNGSNGTATYCKIAGMDVAAKTGTTDENYDRWLCGFTPYYTAVNWYGYDQNESIYFEGKKNPAGIMWANVMARIHANLKKASFIKPNWIYEETICADTGKKAIAGCINTYKENFLLWTTPDECDKHYNTSKGKSNTNRTRRTTNSFDTTTTNDVDNPVKENKKNTIKNETSEIKKETKTNNTINNINTNTNINDETNTDKSSENKNVNINQNNNEQTDNSIKNNNSELQGEEE